MKCSQRVYLKIDEWDLGGTVMGRLRRRMNDKRRLQFGDESQDSVAITNIN